MVIFLILKAHRGERISLPSYVDPLLPFCRKSPLPHTRSSISGLVQTGRAVTYPPQRIRAQRLLQPLKTHVKRRCLDTELAVTDLKFCALVFKIGPCAQPEFLAGPARDLLLSLVVPAPPQQYRSQLEDKAGKAFRWRESELKEVEQLLVPNDVVWPPHLSLLFLHKKRHNILTRTAQDPKEHNCCRHLETPEPKCEKVRQNNQEYRTC